MRAAAASCARVWTARRRPVFRGARAFPALAAPARHIHRNDLRRCHGGGARLLNAGGPDGFAYRTDGAFEMHILDNKSYQTPGGR